MSAIILEVLTYKRESINGSLQDKYVFSLLEGDKVYTTIGFRPAFPIILKAGDVLENMRAIGHISDEELHQAKLKVVELKKRVSETKNDSSCTEKTVLNTKNDTFHTENGLSSTKNTKLLTYPDVLKKKIEACPVQLSLF